MISYRLYYVQFREVYGGRGPDMRAEDRITQAPYKNTFYIIIRKTYRIYCVIVCAQRGCF